MLRPKKTKFKKYRKGLHKNIQKNISLLSSYKESSVLMSSLQFGRISAKQLQSCSSVVNKKIKKLGKWQSKIFPHFPITKKPKEVRMGKGKGFIDSWACKISPGCSLFEISGAKKENSFLALRLAGCKLPLKIKII